jgi:DNA ligase D-like protein (predicted ligase)
LRELTQPTQLGSEAGKRLDVQPKAAFIEPMLLVRSGELPDGPEWLKELKLDGYRAVAIKSGGTIRLRSRNDNDFNSKYPVVAKALSVLPDETVIDGEIVGLDGSGRPSFNTLQNYGSSKAPIVYYVFDVMALAGKDVMGEPLQSRRMLLERRVMPELAEPIRYSPELPGSVADLVQSVKAQGLEGLIVKRRDSRYEPGERTGAWRKMRVNQGQEFVIGGYTVGGNTFDALIFGHYDGKNLMYAARTRNGFTPRLREDLMKKFRPLETSECPFVNLPEARSGRWGAGLTAAKMADCRWLKPMLVGQFEYVEWTPDDHLRHSRFIGLREDKKALNVVREG